MIDLCLLKQTIDVTDARFHTKQLKPMWVDKNMSE